MNEHIWRLAERNQSRRERNRLIRKGFIRPSYAMQPQLMVRSDAPGGWSPEIKTNG